MQPVEINPLDKIDEILEIFKQHNPNVFSCDDEAPLLVHLAVLSLQTN